MSNPDARDEGYFNSYSYISIHEEMLKDTVRTKAYQRAILNSKHLFLDKIVLDVGCGTGILSMFAAKAGAKHVYAVDKSAIINKAREIVTKNNLSNVITLFHSKIEDLDLPIDHVDIIISEWMGYSLLYESMLDSVIFARDKWLIKGGLIFPDKASLYVCGIEDEEWREEKIDWWSNVYGFDMSPLKETALSEPLVDYVRRESVVTDDALIKHFDLYTVKCEDLDFFEVPFTLNCRRRDIIHAFVTFFDITFTPCHKPISFSTGPCSQQSHWKQTVFYLTEPLMVHKDSSLHCLSRLSKNKDNKRHLDVFFGVYNSVDNKTFYTQRDYSLA